MGKPLTIRFEDPGTPPPADPTAPTAGATDPAAGTADPAATTGVATTAAATASGTSPIATPDSYNTVAAPQEEPSFGFALNGNEMWYGKPPPGWQDRGQGEVKEFIDKTVDYGASWLGIATQAMTLGAEFATTGEPALLDAEIKIPGLDTFSLPLTFSTPIPYLSDPNNLSDEHKDFLSLLNQTEGVLRVGNNFMQGFGVVETEFQDIDDATALSEQALAQSGMLGEGVTRDMWAYVMKDGAAPITSAIGDTFWSRKQMTLSEHGIFNLFSKKRNKAAHNADSALTATSAMLMNASTMSIIPGAVQNMNAADDAYVPAQSEVDAIRELTGWSEEEYSDDEIAALIEAAQQYSGSEDPEAWNTWLYEHGYNGESITADEIVTNMAALGATQVSGEPFPTLGGYLMTRAVSTNMASLGSSALLRSHAIMQMDSENEWERVAGSAIVSGGQLVVNEFIRMGQGAAFEGDPENAGEANPYAFLTEDGKINPATVANIAAQTASTPLAWVAAQTEHPDTMAKAFSENMSQVTDAIYSPALHYALAQHGSVQPTLSKEFPFFLEVRDRHEDTAGGDNIGLISYTECGLGGVAQMVYGIHQGTLLMEVIHTGNPAYAAPIIAGALAIGGKYLNYYMLSKPESEVASALEGTSLDSEDKDKNAIRSNDWGDLGAVAVVPLVGWLGGVGLGMLTHATHGIQNRTEEKNGSAVTFAASGPTGSLAGATVGMNLNQIFHRERRNKDTQVVFE